MHLRPPGATINGAALDADSLDALAALDPEDAPPEAVELLESIQAVAREVMLAGLAGQLSLVELSAFEVSALAAARQEYDRFRREQLAGLIGLAILDEQRAWAMVRGDGEFERAKWIAALAAQSRDLLAGGAGEGGEGVGDGAS